MNTFRTVFPFHRRALRCRAARASDGVTRAAPFFVRIRAETLAGDVFVARDGLLVREARVEALLCS